MTFKIICSHFCLVVLISIAQGFELTTVQWCITVWPTYELSDSYIGVDPEHKPLCPGDPAVGVTRQFFTASGFAPGTMNLVAGGELFPKWLDTWELKNERNADGVLEFGADYCLYNLQQSGPKHLGCAQSCYQRKQKFPNPYFLRKYGGDDPDFRDPVAGQINRFGPTPPPNTCLNPAKEGFFSSNDDEAVNINSAASVADKFIGGDWFTTPSEDYSMGIDASTRKAVTNQANPQGWSSELFAASSAGVVPNSNDALDIPALYSNTETTPSTLAGETVNWSFTRSKRGMNKIRMS